MNQFNIFGRNSLGTVVEASPKLDRRTLLSATALTALSSLICLPACKSNSASNSKVADQQLSELLEFVSKDMKELRDGMKGAKQKADEALAEDPKLLQDPIRLRKFLDRTRSSNQDLRISKITFFGMAEVKTGRIIRTDMETDEAIDRLLTDKFPGLKNYQGEKAITVIGSMRELRGVETKPDGQMLYVVEVGSGENRAWLFAGWSWTAYCHRLEYALRTAIRLRLSKEDHPENEPLTYVMILAGGDAFVDPVSPQANADEVKRWNITSQMQAGKRYLKEERLSRRDFGFAAVESSEFGVEGVLLGVLRSAT